MSEKVTIPAVPMSMDDLIRGGKTKNYHREVVIPEAHEDGSPGVLYVKGPSAAYIIKWRRKSEEQRTKDFPGLVIRCLVNKDGSRLVSDESVLLVLSEMPMGIFTHISGVVADLINGNSLGNASGSALEQVVKVLTEQVKEQKEKEKNEEENEDEETNSNLSTN